MSAKEAVSSGIEIVSQSLIQAKAEHTVALATAGTGAITGSGALQLLAGMVSIAVLINTLYNIHLTRLRIQNEKKD